MTPSAPAASPAASVAPAPQLSPEIASMLLESETQELTSSACLRCAQSTVLTLAWPRGDDERQKPADIVVYCAAMNRDITAPVLRCSSFQSTP